MAKNQTNNSILLVEDDKYVGLALKIRLQAAGFEVRIASTATEALEVAATQPPDVALLDYNLPDGNGVELMQEMWQIEATASVRAIVMSASKRKGLREEAMKSGAFEFFEKPFNSNRLVALVNAAVSTPLH